MTRSLSGNALIPFSIRPYALFVKTMQRNTTRQPGNRSGTACPGLPGRTDRGCSTRLHTACAARTYNPGMQRVALFGASGTMGFEAFRELWRRRADYHLTVLLLPGDKRLNRFRPYARETGLSWRPPRVAGAGPVVQDGEGLRIVWGDARDPATARAIVDGCDHVLTAMAVIPPATDQQPELARQVNDRAISHIIEAIREEPDGDSRITYVHTG